MSLVNKFLCKLNNKMCKLPYTVMMKTLNTVLEEAYYNKLSHRVIHSMLA